MLAQERTQRRAPGFRPGTLLQGPRAGGAELATLRDPAPRIYRKRAGPITLPQGTPYGRGRSKQKASQRHDTTTALPPEPPGARTAGAARYGRRPSVPKMCEDLAFIHWQDRRDSRCLDLEPPVVVAPSGEGFRGTIQNRNGGAGCLSGAAGAASSAPPAKTLGARETPARTAGRGRGSRACFLGTSLHEQRSTSRRAGESAPGRRRTGGTVNTGCRTRPSQQSAVCGPKAL